MDMTPADKERGSSLREIFERLRDREDPPAPWNDPSEAPWTEDVFSRDYARAAARDPETSEAELEHIVACTGIPLAPGPREAWKVLDLGCGDGRLLLPLARMGHAGFGIDLGPAPVAELLERAAQHQLPIQAVVGDLRDWARGESGLADHADGAGYDLILLSFGTLGALAEEDARALLERAAQVLRPGAWLHLDLGLSVGFAEELDGRQEWWAEEDFVCGAGPQLVLDDHAFDAGRSVYVRRSFALHLTDPPRLAEVRQTSRLYTADELRRLLEVVGLEAVESYGDFEGGAYDEELSENLIVLARRPD
jgi:SAM-dependent methyltransferase